MEKVMVHPWTKRERNAFLRRVREQHGDDDMVASFCDRVMDKPPAPRAPVPSRVWNEERANTLKALVLAGQKESEIAAAMNMNISAIKFAKRRFCFRKRDLLKVDR